MVEAFFLSNGLRVVLERMPQLRSVAIGLWVKAGSMLELPEENGIAHMMEHMAFKGTASRSARQLAQEMDAIGGHMNAATSKLYTCYYAKVCEADLGKAAGLLADICINPTLEPEELNKERNVILEEIAMGEDSPEDTVYELINEALYMGQSLAMPITGKREQIKEYQREDLLRFRAKYYQPANAVVSVAGKVNKEELRTLLEAHFSGWQGTAEAQFRANQPWTTGRSLTKSKPTEQVQLCVAYPGLSLEDRKRYDMMVLNTIFGGGVSSRLFQSIREEQGLVYSIYSGASHYPGCGDFIISAGSTPGNAKKVIQSIHREAERLLCDGIGDNELGQAKAQLKTGFVLAQESAYSRMSSNGLSQLLRRKQLSQTQVLRRIDSVNKERLMRLAGWIFAAKPCFAIVGKRPERFLQ